MKQDLLTKEHMCVKEEKEKEKKSKKDSLESEGTKSEFLQWNLIV